MNLKYLYPLVFGFLIFFIGVFISGFLHLYDIIPNLDKIYHTLGGFAVGWFFYNYLFSNNQSFSNFKQIIVIASTTCFIAVIWEYAERLSTLYSLQYAPLFYRWFRGGSFNDTLLDIGAGMTGSLIFMLGTLFLLNLKKKL